MFWENIKSEIEYQGLTLKELAARSGVLLQTIYNGMNRNCNPSLDCAYKMAKALNQPLEYLINGDVFPPDNINLPSREKILLKNYRQLPDKLKNAVDNLTKNLVDGSENLESKNNPEIF